RALEVRQLAQPVWGQRCVAERERCEPVWDSNSRRSQQLVDNVDVRGVGRVRRALPRWKEARTRTHNVLIYKAFWLFEGIGWEAGIRTPISASRARSPTVERPPSRQAETPIISARPSRTQTAHHGSL